tara:strand:+ start:732 stop:1184 length:453 start_codon:yes stop_codon:yes gene_type:complete
LTKKLKTRAKELGLTQENANLLLASVAGLGIYGVGVTTLDETVKFAQNDEQYRQFSKLLYGSTPGVVLTSLGLLAGIGYAHKQAMDMGYLDKRASRKAKAAAVGFAGATMMSRLPFMQIGQRFDYLAAGSPSAAINLTGNDAVLLNNSTR